MATECRTKFGARVQMSIQEHGGTSSLSRCLCLRISIKESQKYSARGWCTRVAKPQDRHLKFVAEIEVAAMEVALLSDTEYEASLFNFPGLNRSLYPQV